MEYAKTAPGIEMKKSIFLPSWALVLSTLVIFTAMRSWADSAGPALSPTPPPGVPVGTIPSPPTVSTEIKKTHPEFHHTLKAPLSKGQYCKIVKQNFYSRLIEDSSNRLAFKNSGGLFNQGVCWWHSRLTRLFNMLAVFYPNHPKPKNSETVWKILKEIQSGEVTAVPGYTNLEEFSEAWGNTFQKFLNRWQLQDGVLEMSWATGLSGNFVTTPEALKQTAMEIYNRVTYNKEVVYTMLQYKGITAHSWLITEAKILSNGILFRYHDSNNAKMRNYFYAWGDVSFVASDGKSHFVPYIQEDLEFEQARSRAQQFCAL